MFMKSRNYFLCTLFVFTALLYSCSEDDKFTGDNGGTPPPVTGETIALSENGEAKDIAIETGSPWKAETNASWCQLSQMGGNGGETVKIVAAINTTEKERTAIIRLYAANTANKSFKSKSDTTSALQTIRVTQPGNNEQIQSVCFTDLRFNNGKLEFVIYNPEKKGELTAVSGYDMVMYPPHTGGGRPPKYPPVEIEAGEYYTFTPYVNINDEGIMRGKFAIGGQEAINTLVVNQKNIMRELGELDNLGSCDVHFSDGNRIFFGGGLIEQDPFNPMGEGNQPAYDLAVYDIESNTETSLPNLPSWRGFGFVWKDRVFILCESILYMLDNDNWKQVAQTAENVRGIKAEDKQLYVVTQDATITYNIEMPNGSDVPELKRDTSSVHNEIITDGAVYTSDENNDLWIIDNNRNRFYKLQDGALIASKTDSTSIGTKHQSIGVDNGWLYLTDGQSLSRVNLDGEKESMNYVNCLDLTGSHENIGGTIYNFGGTIKISDYRYGSKQSFKSFRPADYIPMSLTIIPE